LPAGIRSTGSSCYQANTKYLMRFYEFKSSPSKPLTPAQTRIKALKDQAKRAQAAVKAERARQKIQAAHTTLNQLESYPMSKTFRALHKPNNPYSAWIGIGTYGSFNDALAAVLRKKKQGSIAVQIQDSAKMVVYSA
jgi:hypothetical protein